MTAEYESTDLSGGGPRRCNRVWVDPIGGPRGSADVNLVIGKSYCLSTKSRDWSRGNNSLLIIFTKARLEHPILAGGLEFETFSQIYWREVWSSSLLTDEL